MSLSNFNGTVQIQLFVEFMICCSGLVRIRVFNYLDVYVNCNLNEQDRKIIQTHTISTVRVIYSLSFKFNNRPSVKSTSRYWEQRAIHEPSLIPSSNALEKRGNKACNSTSFSPCLHQIYIHCLLRRAAHANILSLRLAFF